MGVVGGVEVEGDKTNGRGTVLNLGLLRLRRRNTPSTGIRLGQNNRVLPSKDR